MIRAALGVCVVSLAMVSPAWAQGTGVSALLVGDIVRFGGADGNLVGGRSNDGEALTFGLRVDQALGSRWGVELEYVRGSEIDNDVSPRPVPLSTSSFEFSSIVGGISTGILGVSSRAASLSILPSYRARARHSTVSTLGWYRQSIGDRSSLVYSAGIAFVIQETETTYEVRGLPFQNTIPAVTTNYTSYTAAPVVGLDARIALTDHAALVPGLRVTAVNNGLLIRPVVGLRWQF